MHRFFAACLIWLLASTAHAFSPGQQVVALNPQVAPVAYSQGFAPINDDLTAGGYPAAGGICSEWGHQVPCNLHYSITRTQTVSSYAAAIDGILVPFVANQLRLSGNGALIEEARTNDALWARDLTQSGTWIAVNMTTAKNATGADGTANAATTLTATAGNATILQTITLGSQADTSSVYLKCITCTGNIQITENNGSTWTTCASLVTTGFIRCSITATLANPIIGLRIVNNSDSVVADFFQMEPGAATTSPIPTTTVAVTRNQDAVTAAGALNTLLTAATATLVVNVAASAQFQSGSQAAIVATAVSTYLMGSRGSTTLVAMRNGGVNTSATLAGAWGSQSHKIASKWNASGNAIVADNGTIVTGSSIFSGGTATIGSDTGASAYDSYIIRLSVFNSFIPDTIFKAMTQ
jgi:hypothetical protein